MSTQPHNPQVSIPPEEDARLPLLEAIIDNQWQKWRPKRYRSLKADNLLKEQIRGTAIACIKVMNDFQDAGLNPDQAREVVQNLIVPQPET